MPPFAPELEEWWLGSGYEALIQLVAPGDDAIDPQECGFAQHIQRRLCALDNDRALQADLEAAWPTIRIMRGINYVANPRKRLKEASTSIFRQVEDGGIDLSRVLEGLGYLDAMEVHRLRLMKATRGAMEITAPEKRHLQVVDELDRQASIHYRHFHLGFRTCILIEDLTKSGEQTKEVPKIMARLNALFPPVVFLQDEDDIDPTPHSAGLRDSIRFSVFEHLMGSETLYEQRQQMIRMKLLGWCDIPGYAQARDALIRYCEESKKLEEVCLAVLDDLEHRSLREMSTRTSSAEPSFVSFEDSSPSPEPSGSSPTKATPDATISADASFDSRYSSLLTPTSLSAIISSNPLLKGMPGREISPAKTDGAAFAGDITVPPILCYPEDLSGTEFCQHPLAQELEMTPFDSDDDTEYEKVSNSRPKNSGKLKRRQTRKQEVPPVPPLPPIPEYFRANLTPKVLEKIVKKMRSRQDLVDIALPEDLSPEKPQKKTSATGTLKLGIRKRRPSMKLQISSPEPIPEAGSWSLGARRNSNNTPILTNGLQSPRPTASRSQSSQDTAHPILQTRDGPKLKYKLAKPRLSPMEYARLYLIEKALSDREDRPCELPKPKGVRYWTPRWEKFLIIPKIPDAIRRDFTPQGATNGVCTSNLTDLGQADSDNESVATLKQETLNPDYPRLSLHLGDLPALSPFMDLPYPDMSNEIFPPNNSPLEVETEESKQLGEPLSPYDDGETSRVRAELETQQEFSQANCEDERGDEKQRREARHRAIHDTTSSSVSEPVSGIKPRVRTEKEPATIIHRDQPHLHHEKQEFWKQMDMDGEGESSSPLSQHSTETAVYMGNLRDQALETPDVGIKKTPANQSRPSIVDFSSANFASLGPRHVVVEFSPHSYMSSEARTPMAHFPIAIQPTSRLTPSTLAKHVIGGAGGHLRLEDTRQAKLVQSLSAEFPQASSAHLWSSESDSSMMPDLRPEPLRVRRRKSQLDGEQGSRRSRAIEEFIEDEQRDDDDRRQESFEMDGSSSSRYPTSCIENDQRRVSGEERALERLKYQLGGFKDSATLPKTLRRSSSSIITPTHSLNALESQSMFNVAENGPSGFTPQRYKDQIASSKISRSSLMGHIEDYEQSESSAQVVEEAAREMRAVRRVSHVSSNASSGLDRSARRQQGAPLRDLERASSITPPGMNSFGFWKNGVLIPRDSCVEEDGTYGDEFEFTDSSELPEEGYNISSQDNFEPVSDKTWDFSQSLDSPKDPYGNTMSSIDAYRFSSQRFDPLSRITTPAPQTGNVIKSDQTTTPSPEPQEHLVQRTPSSTIGSLFRKHVRSHHGGRTPTTPLTPSTHWRPFEEQEPKPPCSSPWMSGRGEDKVEKMERAAYFREKAEQQVAEAAPEKLSIRKSTLSKVRSKEDLRRKNPSLGRRQSMDSLVGWKSFINDAPEPLFSSSPPPPVPPLPAPSRLDYLDARADSGATAAAYKAKKPQGLRVETRKLRKPSRDGLRATRTPISTPSSGGLRTAFKMDIRRASAGRAAAEEGREDEVVARRR
ncbi:hypothetical protein G7Z17_g5744 [Cylindrodendrum hubeiense]|uniref:Uncharacterized protein n=1 Tax=Cylindrodendrum hubeiense TaxID=595255 RepID=A0A9P5LFV9_9HYPO|nr:hypothetical protein G7Z17_g5744 [Cylindrodendrum hubeiense]